ncbi:hypothetical protein DXG01_008244 [Tephrocybe rancida]|nr:hypothetical protein DXG01_008244 [Tephrocybe rancida]
MQEVYRSSQEGTPIPATPPLFSLITTPTPNDVFLFLQWNQSLSAVLISRFLINLHAVNDLGIYNAEHLQRYHDRLYDHEELQQVNGRDVDAEGWNVEVGGPRSCTLSVELDTIFTADLELLRIEAYSFSL